MMVALTIINIVALLAIIFIAFMMFQMMNSFGELIVKFIEQNQEYYKNQKHLLQKSNELSLNMKKLPNYISSLRKVTSKLESTIAKKE